MAKYVIMVLIGAVSYGMLSSFAKIAYTQGYSPAEITFTQALCGAMILWLLASIRGTRPKKASTRSKWQFLAAGAAMGASAYTYYLSVQYIPASLAIILLMQVTWMSILMEWVVFKIKPSTVDFAVTLVILVGTVLAGNLQQIGTSHFSIKGIASALASSLFYAVYVVFNSRLGKDTPMLTKSALLMTGSALMIFAINAKALVTEIHLGIGLLKWGSFLALFGTVIPPVLFAKGMPKIGAGLSSILLTLELPVAVICAHFILSEEITATQIAGILIMLGAIIFMNLHRSSKSKQARLITSEVAA